MLFSLFVKWQRKLCRQRQERILDKLNMPSGVAEEIFPAYSYYHLQNCPAKAPLIVNIHGGGLIMGHMAQNRYWNGYVAAHGARVYSLEYPLIPECNFAKQLQTLAATLNNLSGEFASEPLLLTGDSAGALLAFYLAASMVDEELATALQLPKINVNIKAMCLQCGMFYTTRPDIIGLIFRRHIWGWGFRRHFGQLVNPDYLLHRHMFPPMLLTTTREDFLKQYTLDFYSAARTTGQHVELQCYNVMNLGHAFQVFSPGDRCSHDTIERMLALIS